jgi:hypothetical protein
VVVPGLDRLLSLLRGRDEDPGESTPGIAVPDEELEGRIDAARVRLRETIAPLSDDD